MSVDAVEEKLASARKCGVINSSCVHVNMPKPVDCCVPGCTNNFQNNPALKHYIIGFLSRGGRKATPKLNSNICGCANHFKGRTKRSRNDLPLTFLWSKAVPNRPVLKTKG